jgi:cytochrome c-type biogenesis protein CcmH
MKFFKFILIVFLSFFILQKNLIANDNSKLINKISKNLRCLICQGQSIYDSQSDFAISMKLLIKKKIEEGDSEKKIYQYLKNQYGEWIVYDPELNKKTIFLWLFPLILFVFGGLLIFRKVFIN